MAIALGSASAANSPAEAAAGDELAEVVVTGSLIQRPNNTAVSPITTISQEAIKESGTANLEDALNQMPGFTVGGNASTGGQGTGARATINLHGLGTNRNLVLLDGKRLPVSSRSGDVDVNILPEAIIGGVDAITGGASAVYGSDAISGVVNFKTVRSLEGAVVDLYDSRSSQGDTNKFNASLSFGSQFGSGNGHVVTAFAYTKQDPLNGSQRPFFFDKVPSGFLGTGTFVPSATNAPTLAAVQGLFGGYGSALPTSALGQFGFNNDGTLYLRDGANNYKGPNGSGGYAVIGGAVRMPVGQQIDYINGLKRKTAFVKADYDLTPDLNVYGQFMFVDLAAVTHSGGSLTQFPTLTTIPVSNPFIPADLRTLLASRPNPTAAFGWSARYVGVPYKGWNEDYQVQQYMVGLKGSIGDRWSFDGYVEYDESNHDSVMHNAVLKNRVQTLLNAADGGRSICAGGFNPFGDTNARSLSPACQAYITSDEISKELLSQTQVQLQVNGKLFDLGAGPAQIAVVADRRFNSYEFSPASDVTANSGFSPGANVEGFTATVAVPKRSIGVNELAAQVDVPLVSGKRGIEELAVGAAARYSDYSTSGSVSSHEVDLRWRPVDSLLFRSSYQRAVRAPNIAELYTPPGSTNQLAIGTPPGAIGDPCDVRSVARTGANAAQVAALCVAQGVPAAAIGVYQFNTTATGQTAVGNTTLKPETADTLNLGFVFNARKGDGPLGDFALSLDYYNIKIEKVISTAPGLGVLAGCYNLDGTNPGYSASNVNCQAIFRDSTGQLLFVGLPYANLGGLRTSGYELQIHWGLPVSSGWKFNVDSNIGKLSSYEVQVAPGGPFLNYTNISSGTALESSVPPRATPKLKAVTTFSLRSDKYTAGLRWRYQGAMDDVSKVNTPATVAVGVPVYQLWDLFGNMKLREHYELRAGVTNLLDKGVPIVASNQGGTDPALYDIVGRTYYLGLRAKF
jgi:iron complex outermembrane recepter protein